MYPWGHCSLTFPTDINHEAKSSGLFPMHVLRSFKYLSVKHCCFTWCSLLVIYLEHEEGMCNVIYLHNLYHLHNSGSTHALIL